MKFIIFLCFLFSTTLIKVSAGTQSTNFHKRRILQNHVLQCAQSLLIKYPQYSKFIVNKYIYNAAPRLRLATKLISLKRKCLKEDFIDAITNPSELSSKDQLVVKALTEESIFECKFFGINYNIASFVGKGGGRYFGTCKSLNGTRYKVSARAKNIIGGFGLSFSLQITNKEFDGPPTEWVDLNWENNLFYGVGIGYSKNIEDSEKSFKSISSIGVGLGVISNYIVFKSLKFKKISNNYRKFIKYLKTISKK